MVEHKQYPDAKPQRPLAPEPDALAGAPAASSNDDVAAILKGTREQYGRNLRDVAGALNIRFIYLEAIEAGEFDKLPGTAYAIGFVRSYADYLGLDSKDLVRQFKAEVEGLGKQTQLVFPTPVPESKVPGGALILVSIVCFALAYGAWSFFSSQETQVADLVPEVPERLQPLIDEVTTSGAAPGDAASDGVAAAGESLVGQAVPADALPIESPPMEVPVADSTALPSDQSGEAPASSELPAAPSAVPRETATESVAEPAASSSPETQLSVAPPAPAEEPQTASEPVPTQGAAIPAAPAAIPAAPAAIPAAPADGTNVSAMAVQAPQVYGLENSGSRIVLRAVQDSWVQVRNSQDDLLLTRVLRAGDSYRVPNQTGLTLLTGNAGGLELEVDGNSLGPVGPVGSVRRNVSLDPARLLSGSAARE